VRAIEITTTFINGKRLFLLQAVYPTMKTNAITEGARAPKFVSHITVWKSLWVHQEMAGHYLPYSIRSWSASVRYRDIINHQSRDIILRVRY